MLNNKTILVTGGTGSFGTKFTSVILRKYPKINVEKILIEMYNFLLLYNCNYRPIFHLEYIILFIFNNVNICK